jgi:hypothetical protein
MFKSSAVILLSLVVISVSGCAHKKNVGKQSASPTQSQNISLAECDKELQALKQVGSAHYDSLDKRFELMMKSSANYGNVRNAVSMDTQTTLDALYTFQASRVCADIRNAMLNSLIDNAGIGQP